MKAKWQILSPVMAILAISALALAGCGGSSGTGTTPAANTAAQKTASSSAPKTVSSAGTASRKQLTAMMSAMRSNALVRPTVSQYTGGTDVPTAYSQMQASRSQMQALGAPSAATSTCPVSGTITTTPNNTNTGGTMTFNACVLDGDVNGDGVLERITLNGQTAYDMTNTGFSFADTNIHIVANQLTGNTVGGVFLDATSNASGSATFATAPSQANPNPDYTMSMNGSQAVKVSLAANGTWDVDQSMTFNNASAAITGVTTDNTGKLTGLTVTESGGIAMTDNLNANNSMSVSIAAASPLVMKMTFGAGFMTQTMDGTATITTSCFSNLTMTLATVTPMTIPSGNGGPVCPTAGKLNVTAGGGTATITFTATGGMEIVDSAGTKTTYASCSLAGACN